MYVILESTNRLIDKLQKINDKYEAIKNDSLSKSNQNAAAISFYTHLNVQSPNIRFSFTLLVFYEASFVKYFYRAKNGKNSWNFEYTRR